MSAFRVFNKVLHFETKGEIEFVNLTAQIERIVSESGITNGFVHVFAPHATGILTLTEDDPALLRDIENLLHELIPGNRPYNHPSNAHAHLRSVLIPPDRSLPLIGGRIELGTWQSLFFVETDVQRRRRKVIVQVIGE